MTTITLEQSSERLRQALPLMAQHKVPVTPENYWVWYQYISRDIMPLTETIEKMIAAGEIVDETATQDLYKRYIANPGQAQLENAEGTVRRLLESMSNSLNTADSEVSRYEASLDECAEELNAEISPDRIRDLVDVLSKSTHRMHEGSAALHANLDESRNEVKALKRELEQVKAQAKIDPLTNLKNRVGLEESLEAMRELPDAANATHALLIADIDRFKKINDTYGHIFGDKILKVVGKALEQVSLEGAIAARFGGEEFIVVAPSADIERGLELSENIRASIASGRIFNPKTKQEIERVTISIGVTEFNIAESIDAVIERADEALYRAKENGRNRVEVAGETTAAVASA